jgi:hypothetical protein
MTEEEGQLDEEIITRCLIHPARISAGYPKNG